MNHGPSSSLTSGDRIRVRVLYLHRDEHTRPQGHVDAEPPTPTVERVSTLQTLTTTEPGSEHEFILHLVAARKVTPYEEWWTAHTETDEAFAVRFATSDSAPVEREPHLPRDILQRINLPFAFGTHAGWSVTAWRLHDGVSLRTWRARDGKGSDWRSMIRILSSLANLLGALHRSGYAVLELRPERIRVADDGEVVFDHTEYLFEIGKNVFGTAMRPGYVHPRYFDAGSHNIANPDADMYAFAAVAWFLMTGADPPSTAMTGFVPAAPIRAFMPDLPVGIAPNIEPILRRSDETSWLRPRTLVERLETAFIRHYGQQEGGAPGLTDHPISEFQIVGETHPGIAKRIATPRNQDSIYYDVSGETAILVVADGVSTATYGRGDIASELFTRRVKRAWKELDDFDIDTAEDRRRWLTGLVRKTNRDLVRVVNENWGPFPPNTGIDVMATTAVVGLIHEGRMTLASVGDSPAFLVRDGTIERLNRDHNIYTLELANGGSPERASSLEWPDALARCIGTYSLNSAGEIVARDIPVDVFEFELLYGDRIALCSDGITDYIGADPDDAMDYLLELMIEEPVPALAALEAILEANRGGGGDNLSAVLCYAEEQFEPLVLTSEWVVPDE